MSFMLPLQMYRQWHNKKQLQNVAEICLQQASTIPNKFLRTLMLQVVNCATNDGQDFLQLQEHANVKEMHTWIGMFHTISFLLQNDNDGTVTEGNATEIQNAFFLTFDTSEKETKQFACFYEMGIACETTFGVAFSKAFVANMLGNKSKNIKKDCESKLENEPTNPILVAFVRNFIYNAYEGFISSFTSYTPVNRLGEWSVQNGRQQIYSKQREQQIGVKNRIYNIPTSRN